MNASVVERSRARIVLGMTVVVCVVLGSGFSAAAEGVVPLTGNCWCRAVADQNSQTAWNFAEASGNTSHTWSHALVRCTNGEGLVQLDALAETGLLRDWATADILESQSTLAVGVAPGIPAGTPLTLRVHAENLGHPWFEPGFRLYRGAAAILEFFDYDDQFFDVQVFAGETLRPSLWCGGTIEHGEGRLTLTVIPEPATLVGLLVLGALVRRR